jgi:NADPH:quinone reductase-like Zn-dependent oxidoreductase
MRAALFHEHGGPEVLRVEEVAPPRPAEGEALVRVRAAALNHLDLWVRRGLPLQIPLPHIGGSDVAGVVEQLGPGVEGWAPGDRVVVNPSLWCGRCRACIRGQESMCARFRVLGEHTPGALAELVVVPASNLYHLPEHVPFETAAALPVSYQTAWRALISRARLRAGEEVLVLGASGGTAMAALQIARLAGARVYAVTSGAEQVARVRDLGADVTYDREAVDFSTEVYRDTGKRGVDVVVENVGAATWRQSLRALAKGGRLVTYGATSGPQGDTDLRALFWKQLEIIGSTMASRAEFEQVLDIAFRGALTPVIDSMFPLEEVRRAHERLEAGEHFGKIVLRP